MKIHQHKVKIPKKKKEAIIHPLSPPLVPETLVHPAALQKPFGEWMIVKSRKSSRLSKPTPSPANKCPSPPRDVDTSRAPSRVNPFSRDPSPPFSRVRMVYHPSLPTHPRKIPSPVDKDVFSCMHTDHISP